MAEIHDNPQKATVIPASYDNSESSRTTDLSVAQNVDNDMESILYRKAELKKRRLEREQEDHTENQSRRHHPSLINHKLRLLLL